MHDVEATRFKVEIPIITLFKALYPTYSHYLESLQASAKLKNINFETLVENFSEREKEFGKRKITYQSRKEFVCLT